MERPMEDANELVQERDDEGLGLLIRAALLEDVGAGDWTTLWTVGPGEEGVGEVVAKEPVVVAGTRAAVEVFARVDPRLRVTIDRPDGEPASKGDVLLRVEGPLRGILTGERTALNFLGRLSGIATLTRKFVESVEGTGAVILDTRKTTPGWRLLEKEAVRAGGGRNHRFGLHDMVLIKDNHRSAAGGLTPAVVRVQRENAVGIPVEVEVDSLEELEEALALGVDRILLDNMTIEVMARAVRRVRTVGPGRPLLEASGNVTLENVRTVAETGVDLISIGALTHSAPAADLSLRVVGKG